MNFKTVVKACELKLADVVMDRRNLELGLLTVKNIKDDLVSFVRPYTHTGDFSYTGGVICYTGVEEFTHSIDAPGRDYVLISSKTLK